MPQAALLVSKPRSSRELEFFDNGLQGTISAENTWARMPEAGMLRINLKKWGQSVEDLRCASLEAVHSRTRERFQALYLIASGQFNATTCAIHIGRNDETVLGWIHCYNEHGPKALSYRRTGGSAPLLPLNKPSRLLNRLKKQTLLR
jgi:hypothetical protein